VATLEIQAGRVRLRFSALERIGGLRKGAEVALEEIESVEVSSHPWREAKGVRVGTGFPGLVLLGTMLRKGKNDVVAVYGNAPILIIRLEESAPYHRWLITVPDAEIEAARLRAAMESARSSGSAPGATH